MYEFLIKRTDGDWFDLHANRFAEVLHPTSFASRPVEGWGDHRIEVDGVQISFSYEDPGFHICFEGEGISESKAKQIVNEICSNIIKATGQSGKVVTL